FARYHWPGNVRQLAQAVERVYAIGEVPVLPEETAPAEDRPTAPRLAVLKPDDARSGDAPLPALDLETLRRIAVRQALALTNGHKGRAAALLGVHINTMTKLAEEAMPALSRRRGQKPR
ncbi:MAG: helix-turn-helix domain-containing protein, partial [Planctomycetaceae bacterium]